MTLTKPLPHPELKQFIGEKCIIRIGKREYHRTIHFIGRNGVGRDVITFTSRGIHHVDSWESISITIKYTNEQ